MSRKVLIRPIVSEKSLHEASAVNCYTFEVRPTANKDQIAAAVADVFDVKVVKVRTLSLQPKSKRTGRRRLPSPQARTKKAYVFLAEGDSIDLFDFGGEK